MLTLLYVKISFVRFLYKKVTEKGFKTPLFPLQVLDKKQYALRSNGKEVYAVDIKEYWWYDFFSNVLSDHSFFSNIL